MGWTGTHREPGKTDREFFEAEFCSDGRNEILACATMAHGDGSQYNAVFYAAVRTVADGNVWGLVVLIRRARSDGDGDGDAWFNFHYKDMSEDMGPTEARCPARILDLLSPLPECDHGGAVGVFCGTCFAREWRASSRKAAEQQARARKVKAGTVVRFPRPFKFQSGAELATFVFEARNTFRGAESGYYGGRYRITGWRQMHFEVVTS